MAEKDSPNLPIWRWLTEPAASIQEPDRRRQARLLASFLVILAPLSFLLAAVPNLVDPTRRVWQDPSVRGMVVAVAVWAVAYALNRSGHYLLAAVLAIGTANVMIFVWAVPYDSLSKVASLVYLIIPVFFSIILLSAWATVVLVAANLGGILLLAIFFPNLTLVHGPWTFVLTVSLVVLFFIYHRDRLETDRQAELTDKEERYRTIFERANDAVLLMSNDVVVDCNARTLEMFACRRDEIVGHAFTEFSPLRQSDGRNSKEITAQRIEAAIGGVPQQFVWQNLRRDGTVFDAQVSLSRLLLGKEAFLETIVRDVTGEWCLEQKLTAIHALGREMVLAGDIQQIAHAVVEASCRVLEFRVCGLWLVDPERNVVVRRSHAADIPIPDIGPLPLDGERGIVVGVVRSGEPIYLAQVGDDPRYIPGDAVSHSELCVPLKVRGRVIGALNAESDQPAAFSDEDQRLFQTLADVAAVALENARLHLAVTNQAALLEEQVAARTSDLERRSVQLQVAAEVARDATVASDLDDLLNRAVNLIRHRFAFYHVGIFLVDEQGEYAVLRAATGEAGRQMLARGHKLKVGETGIVGHSTGTGQPRIALDVGVDAFHFHNPSLPETRSEMALPLKVGERIIGALDVQSHEESAFDKDDVAVLQTLADQLAVAIEKVRLFAQAQAALEERLGTVVSNAPVILFALDREGVFTLSEGKGLDVLGLRPGEVVGQSVFDLYRDVPQILENIRCALAGEAFISTVGIGGLVFETWYSPLRDQGGDVVGVIGVSTDITERVRAEEALRESEGRLKVLREIDQAILAARSPEAIALAALDHIRQLVPCRRASVALFDFDTGQGMALATRGEEDVILPRGKQIPLAEFLITEDMRKGKVHVVKDTLALANPPVLIVELRARGIRSYIAVPFMRQDQLIGSLQLGADNPSAFTPEHVEIAHEVADQLAIAIVQARLHEQVQRHAEELELRVAERTAELRDEQARTQAILDAAGEGIIVTNLGGAILYMNPAATRLTGYSLAEASLDTPRLWKSGQHGPEFYQQMWEPILAGEVWRGELVNRRKDGTLYDAALTIAPIPDEDGRPAALVGIQNDISHLKELDRLKDEFVSNVSHELRTPLANIKLYLSLLQRGRKEKQTQYLDTLRRETGRLGGLIEDLLDISRLDRGVPVTMEAVDLEALTADVLTNHLPQAQAKRIELSFQALPNLPLAWASATQIMQVLTNLVGNALAYTPAEGHVTVSLTQSEMEGETYLLVSVRDDGPGISPQDLPRIFDRFYRGAVGRQSSAPGTGLGLAICKEIVDLHGGRIKVESGEGRGSVFSVWLPIAK